MHSNVCFENVIFHCMQMLQFAKLDTHAKPYTFVKGYRGTAVYSYN